MLVVRSYYPRAEEYLQNKWFFDEYVKLGVFHESDYMNENLNHLAFRLNSYIAKRYFRFSDSIMKEVNDLLVGIEARDLVGYHIRMGDAASDVKEHANFLYSSDVMRFINCSHIHYTPHSVLYVASDSSLAKQWIKNTTSYRTLFQQSRVSHSWNDIREGVVSSAVKQVLVDIGVLSKCSVIVGTLGSSLTYLAACLQGSIPYYVTRNRDCYYPLNLTTFVPLCLSLLNNHITSSEEDTTGFDSHPSRCNAYHIAVFCTANTSHSLPFSTHPCSDGHSWI